MSTLPAPTPGPWPRTVRWLGANRVYVLGVLTVIAAIQAVDRYILIAAMEPVKHEFGVSDAAMGSLVGLWFSLSYCAMALPLGFLADRLPRVRLLSGLLFIWAGCTVLGTLSRQFATLLAARLVVGAAESGATPISVSLIADHFKLGRRAGPLGVLAAGGVLGAGLAFLVGALVIERFGWRTAFMVAGIPGMALALIALLTIREPVRGGLDGGTTGAIPTMGWAASFRLVLSTPRYLLLCLAFGLANFTGAAYATWVSSVLIRDHGLPIGRVALIAAIGFGLLAAVGGAIIANLAQRLAKDRPERLAATAAACSMVICGLGVWMIFCGDPRTALVLFLLTCIVLTGWTAPNHAMTLEAVPASTRAMAMSISMIVATIAGGFGPAVVGLLSDRLPGPHALGHALAIVLLVDLLAAAAFLAVMVNIAWARRGPRKDQEKLR